MAGETWQGGLLRMPAWIEKGPDGKPYRPWAALWVSRRTGLVHMKMEAECGAHDPALALEALVEFALNKKLAEYRPARPEVPDEELCVHLVRALGPRMFEEQAGHFWGMVQTRPYMRARFGLACCLEDLGQVDEAIGHYRELLRLNPNDNQGVRDVLLPALFAMGRDGEAGKLLQQFGGDISAAWKYGWALWTFRREGDSELARQRLREAVRANRHVPRYLTGKAEWPGPLPGSYALGSEEEAVICADELGDAWRRTPWAEHWLNAVKPKKKSPARRRR
jgi:tetratricopeptide (TPR) repeat protein